MLVLETLTDKILGAAFEVHRVLGPGLLESTYQACLLHELRRRGILTEREVLIPIAYKGVAIDNAYRADLVVEGKVLVELKAVEHVHAIHEAQILTYLKHGKFPVGLLLNFNVKHLKSGIHRFVGPTASACLPDAATALQPWHE